MMCKAALKQCFCRCVCNRAAAWSLLGITPQGKLIQQLVCVGPAPCQEAGSNTCDKHGKPGLAQTQSVPFCSSTRLVRLLHKSAFVRSR